MGFVTQFAVAVLGNCCRMICQLGPRSIIISGRGAAEGSSRGPASQSSGSKWNFTILRSGGAICGISLGSPMNLMSVIAVYAAISREIGLPFRFPAPSQSIAPFISTARLPQD